MNALGIFYQYGKGGESTDYREAKRLYEKAVAGTSKEAERNLERINTLLSEQKQQTPSAPQMQRKRRTGLRLKITPEKRGRNTRCIRSG